MRFAERQTFPAHRKDFRFVLAIEEREYPVTRRQRLCFSLPIPLWRRDLKSPTPSLLQGARQDIRPSCHGPDPRRARLYLRFAAPPVPPLLGATHPPSQLRDGSTSYARARLDYYFHGAKFAPALSVPANDPDPDYVAHTRTTKANVTGRFTFENVPPGEYFISSQVLWKPEGAWLSEGGLIYEKVTVTGAETEPLRVIVSGK